MGRIAVTDHAVDQYRDRVLQFTREEMTDAEIKALLAEVVKLGKRIRKLPGQAAEYQHDGLSVTVIRDGPDLVVLTFNGDRVWRGWWHKQEVWVRGSEKVAAAL